MGCDIHAHVETGHKYEGKTHWSHLCDFRFGRNYLLFALMAGVRRYSYLPDATKLEESLAKRGAKTLDDPFLSEEESQIIVQEASDNGITRGQPSFQEKGIPKDIDWKTASDYTLHIVEDGEPECDLEGHCSRSQADRWVQQGSSEVWDEIDGKAVTITGPDWHTPSWLDTNEMEQVAQRMSAALKDYGDMGSSDSLARVEGLVMMMKRLTQEKGITARVVFWFDN